MKSKWFSFMEKRIFSKTVAHGDSEAWEKTLEKWAWKMDGYEASSGCVTCGLCDVYRHGSTGCIGCPIHRLSATGCVPFDENCSLEYLFLLIIKEAHMDEIAEKTKDTFKLVGGCEVLKAETVRIITGGPA